MSKFTSQEVSALQQGGNQHAKEIYLKEWDSQRSVPDSSHVERLRDFIKQVYVDRIYTGERNYDKPPRAKMGEKENLYDNQRVDSYQGGSRSPPYEDTERCYSYKSSPGGSYDGRKSPGYEQESRRYGDYGRSPSQPQFVNDWSLDDKQNGRRDEDHRVFDGDTKLDGRSPERPKDIGSATPPVRDILGEHTVPLSEPPKADGRAVDVSSQTLRTASSSSLVSTNEKPVEVKLETAGSLIDFDAQLEPPAAAAVPQAQQSTVTQSTTQSVSSNNDNNWASFDAFSQTITQTYTVNPLESVLSELLTTTPVPAPASGIPGQPMHVTNYPSIASSPSNSLTFPLSAASVSAPGLTVNGYNSFAYISGAEQDSTIQHQQHSLFPSTSNQPIIQQFTPVTGHPSIQQPWSSSPAQSMEGYLGSSTAQGSQPVPKSANEVTSDVESQASLVDVKLSGRKELPVDLFTATYSAFPATVPGWQMGPPGGMGFSMQYDTATSPMPTFQQSVKSPNPFDVSNEPSPAQAPTFPSMASLHDALPNALPQSSLMRTSSLGSPSSAWMPESLPYKPALPPQASSYGSALSPQALSNASAMPPRTCMGQQVLGNAPPSGHQGFGSIGAEEAAFGSLSVDQQFADRFSAPPSPSPFSSVGGNPFG